jgi:FAD/FMN-containing dehydrogenase
VRGRRAPRPPTPARTRHARRSAEDLFWGLRGGGGNFGIVTSFEYQVHPIGPTVLAGMLLYPLDQAADVLAYFRDYVSQAPDEVGILGNLRPAPPLPVVPPELHGKPVVAMVVCYAGAIEDGEKEFKELRRFATPALDAIAPKPYLAHSRCSTPRYRMGAVTTGSPALCRRCRTR